MILRHDTINDIIGNITQISTSQLNQEWSDINIITNNEKGTFRGLYTNKQPKYIKVIKGSLINFLYNPNTKNLEYFTINNQNAQIIPSNITHGFLTLEDNTIITLLSKEKIDNENILTWENIPELNNIIKITTQKLNTNIKTIIN